MKWLKSEGKYLGKKKQGGNTENYILVKGTIILLIMVQVAVVYEQTNSLVLS